MRITVRSEAGVVRAFLPRRGRPAAPGTRRTKDRRRVIQGASFDQEMTCDEWDEMDWQSLGVRACIGEKRSVAVICILCFIPIKLVRLERCSPVRRRRLASRRPPCLSHLPPGNPIIRKTAARGSFHSSGTGEEARDSSHPLIPDLEDGVVRLLRRGIGRSRHTRDPRWTPNGQARLYVGRW